MVKKYSVDSIRVSSPCTESWEMMRGNDKIRFCSHCSTNVNNISQMKRREASKLVKKSKGRLCIRYIQHPVTKSPVFADRLYQISRRAGIAAGVLGASLAVSNAVYAQGSPIKREPPKEKSAVVKPADQTAGANKEKKDIPTGSISGYVFDSQGAIVQGASVTISGSGFQRTVSTNEDGEYLISDIPASKYDLKVAGDGFEDKDFDVTIAEKKNTAINASLSDIELWDIMGDIVSVVSLEPLHSAVAENNAKDVINLLAGGADVNFRDEANEGTTPLFLAVKNGNLEIVEALLNFGAKVNAQDDNKRTALMNLDYETTPEIVSLLLKYNASVSNIDSEGNNVLHFAAENEEPEIIRILINNGAELDAQNDEGQTPLMIAAYFENFETLRALIEAGAKLNIRDKEGETALSIAKSEKGEDIERIIEILIQYGANE